MHVHAHVEITLNSQNLNHAIEKYIICITVKMMEWNFLF